MSNLFTPLSAIFNIESERRYLIPPYQREYSWTEKQVIQLCDDINDNDNDEGYFVGTLLTAKSDSTIQDPYNVIDGQQRLTTISLIFLAIYKTIKAYDKENERLTDIKRKLVKNNLARVDLHWTKDNKRDYYKLLIEEDVVKLENVKKMIRKTENMDFYYSGNEGNRRLTKNFRKLNQYFNSNQIENKLEFALEFYEKLNRVEFVEIPAKTSQDAYTLFETLNNRGTPLTLVDLLKIDFFNVDQNNAEDKWENFIKNLGEAEDVSYHTRYLIANYEATVNNYNKEKWAKGLVQRVTKRTAIDKYSIIFKNLKSEFRETLIENALYFAKIETKKIFELCDIGEGGTQEVVDELNEKMKVLYNLDSTQIHPFLLFILDKFPNNQSKYQALIEYIDLLIKFFVRRNITNIPQARDVRSMSSNIITKISSEENITLEQVSEILKEKLQESTCTDTVLIDELETGLYDKHYHTARRVLIMLELSEKPNNKEVLKDFEKYDSEKKKYAWEIEHIFPKGDNIPDWWINMINGEEENHVVSEENRKTAQNIKNKLVHNIGNLTLTGYNQEMSNFPLAVKKTYLNESLFLNGLIFESETWNEESIKNRKEFLINKVVKLFKI